MGIGKDLGMDFFVLRICAVNTKSQFSYTGNQELKIKFTITPVPNKNNTDALKIFARTVDVGLKLLPSKSAIYIRDDLSLATHKFYDHEKKDAVNSAGWTDLSDQSNYRQ